MRRLLFARACAALAMLAWPSIAHAREPNVMVEGAFDLSTTWTRSMPRLNVDGSDTELGGRSISGASLPSTGSSTFVGGGLDSALVVSDRWIFLLGGATIAGAVGTYPRILTSVSGSMAEMHPWTAWEGDILLPGVGLRFKEHRWLFAAAVRTGVSLTGMAGSAAYGVDRTDVQGSAVSLLVRAQLEACRRFDPVERLCLLAAPAIYQFGFGNGGTLGLRWEVDL